MGAFFKERGRTFGLTAERQEESLGKHFLKSLPDSSLNSEFKQDIRNCLCVCFERAIKVELFSRIYYSGCWRACCCCSPSLFWLFSVGRLND